MSVNNCFYEKVKFAKNAKMSVFRGDFDVFR